MSSSVTIESSFDIGQVRNLFPVLKRKVKGKSLVYLDNAATTQKPQMVIDGLVAYYSGYNANIHRGIHTLAEEATAAYEQARHKAAKFIHAESTDEIIFTRGTTEGINLVASTWGRKNISNGDIVLISGMEHHSNIVPWQILIEEKGGVLEVIPVLDSGELDMEAFRGLIQHNPKLVAINHASNALGTVNPVQEIISISHDAGALVLIDGAQSVAHLEIDVQALDADFYSFSSHKMYGPTGVGVLYGKRNLLEAMPPYQGGGEMIKEVSFMKTTYNELPYKYEAGTPNIADVISFGLAIDFINSLGKSNIYAHERSLLDYGTSLLKEINGLQIIGEAQEKLGVISFIIEGIHPQDIGILLDNAGVAIRTGHHCTQPLMERFKIPGTSRASFAVYNTMSEIDVLVQGIRKAVKLLI